MLDSTGKLGQQMIFLSLLSNSSHCDLYGMSSKETHSNNPEFV